MTSCSPFVEAIRRLAGSYRAVVCLEPGLFQFEPNFAVLTAKQRVALEDAMRLSQEDAARGASLSHLFRFRLVEAPR